MLFLDNSPLPEVSFSFLDQNGQIIFTQRTLRGQRSPVPTLGHAGLSDVVEGDDPGFSGFSEIGGEVEFIPWGPVVRD